MNLQEQLTPFGAGIQLGIPSVPPVQVDTAADLKQPETYERIRKEIIEKAWRDEEFKKALMTDAKKALEEEFNMFIPQNVKLKVVEETENTFYLVLPNEPTLIDPDVSMWL